MHFSLGANLARLEIRVLFVELLLRLAHIAQFGASTYARDDRSFGLKRRPIRFAAS